MSEVTIANLDRVDLLQRMWNHAPVARFFAVSGVSPPSFDRLAAQSVIDKRIDYFQGRCIKTDLSMDVVDPFLYDRDAGEGKLAAIVKEMQSET